MGYESKLYIVNKRNTYAEIIAEFNLCKMGSAFAKCFTDEIDFKMFINGEYTNTDMYGDICRAASVPDVIATLEKIQEDVQYRQLAPCIGLLKGFRPEEWKQLLVVHYGY